MSIEGVEIDDKITALSRQYFSLPDDVKVTTYDGRAYLQAIDEKYDVIMVDAYQDITIPFQMFIGSNFYDGQRAFKRERRDGRKHEYARKQ